MLSFDIIELIDFKDFFKSLLYPNSPLPPLRDGILENPFLAKVYASQKVFLPQFSKFLCSVNWSVSSLDPKYTLL